MSVRMDDYIYIDGSKFYRGKKKNKLLKDLDACLKLKNSNSIFDVKSMEKSIRKELKRCRTATPIKSYKKIPKKKLKKMILEYIRNCPNDYICKENLAFKFKVKQHFVEEVFKELNREGILSQRESSYAHDSTRNPIFYGAISGWASDKYYILKRN